MFKYSVFLICFCCSIVNISFAQDSLQTKEKNRYLFLGLGITSQILQDPAVSPMRYNGAPIHIAIGYEKHKERLISRFELNGDIGALSSSNATEVRPMKSSFYRIDLQYTYLRKAIRFKENTYTLWLGGKYLWHNSLRLTPQNDTGFISFLIANSLKASAVLQRAYMLRNKNLTVQFGIDLPLISHVIRPSYLNIFDYLSPENDWLGERLEESKFYTINRFPGLNTRLALTYPIKGGNALRLAYHWEFYHLNELRRVNYARQLFQFSFLAKI